MGQISPPTELRSPTKTKLPTKTRLPTELRSPTKTILPRKLNIDSKLKAFKDKKMINILNHLVTHMNALIKKMEESDKKNDKTVLSNLKQFLNNDGKKFGLKMKPEGTIERTNIKMQKGGSPTPSNNANTDAEPETTLTTVETNSDIVTAAEGHLMEKIKSEGFTPENLAALKEIASIQQQIALREQQLAHNDSLNQQELRHAETFFRGNVLTRSMNAISRYIVGVAAYYGAHHTLRLANGLIGPITSLVGSFCSLIFISFFGAIADGINGITSRIPFYGGDAVPRPQDILNEILDEAMLNDNAEGFAGIIQTLEQAGEGGYYLSLMVLFFLYLGIFSIAYQIWNSEDLTMFWGFFRVRRNVEQGPETRMTRTRSRTPSPNKAKRSKRKTKKIKKNKTRNRKNKRRSKKMQKNKRRSKNRKQSKKKKRKAKK